MSISVFKRLMLVLFCTGKQACKMTFAFVSRSIIICSQVVVVVVFSINESSIVTQHYSDHDDDVLRCFKQITRTKKQTKKQKQTNMDIGACNKTTCLNRMTKSSQSYKPDKTNVCLFVCLVACLVACLPCN